MSEELFGNNNNNALFINYCRLGLLEEVKKIKYLIFQKNVLSKGFLKACVNGHLETAKWLYTVEGRFYTSKNSLLIGVCMNNQLEVLQWLYKIDPQILSRPQLMVDVTENALIKKYFELSNWLLDFQPYMFNKLFYSMCAKNHIETVKYMYGICPEYSLLNYFSAFCSACSGGSLEIAKWILEIHPELDISASNEYAFCCACENNHIEIVKWLFEINPTMDISALDEDAFCKACNNGHIEIVKLLFEIKPTINISILNEYAFRRACQKGHIEIAKLLLEVKHDINLLADHNGAFCGACDNSCLEVIKWLLELTPTINVSCYFHSACESGNINTAKLLFELKPSDIDIYAENDYLFRFACDNDCLDVAKWLCSLNPTKYSLVIVDQSIDSFYINENIIITGSVEVNSENCDDCPICYEKNANIRSNCNHCFCEDCITLYYRSSSKTCPCCRQTLSSFVRLVYS
jgi:ankyrin repeat protein